MDDEYQKSMSDKEAMFALIAGLANMYGGRVSVAIDEMPVGTATLSWTIEDGELSFVLEPIGVAPKRVRKTRKVKK